MISQLGFYLSLFFLLIMMVFDVSKGLFYTLATIWLVCLLVGIFGPVFAKLLSMEPRPSLWFTAGAGVELVVALFLVLRAYGKGFY